MRFRSNGKRPQEQPETAVEVEPAVAGREAAEALTSALYDSDTAADILHDSAEHATQPGRPRMLLGLGGLVLTVSSLLAVRRWGPGRRNKPASSRLARLLHRDR